MFTRGIGESSDIVRKEMYTFTDRGDRSLTLRPEATAPVVRAFIEHNLGAGLLPVKLFYFGNMFRYERPQAGRYREFWQLGVESLGSSDPSADAESIAMAVNYIHDIGIEKSTLMIGSMGDESCRASYVEKLRGELAQGEDALCEDCLERARINPLRVFDCKNPGCRRSLEQAPKMLDNLCDDCAAHFSRVRGLLDDIGVEYKIDPMLVRGFDYYTRTTFEIVSEDLGAQNALGGGGRYDRLVEDYGGKPTPAVGFALGVERLLLALGAAGAAGPASAERAGIFVAVVDDKDRKAAFKLAAGLRDEGFYVELDQMGRGLRSQMKLADKLNAEFAVVLGPEELSRGEVVVRDLARSTETSEPISALREFLRKGTRDAN